jgi:hypothetical protein
MRKGDWRGFQCLSFYIFPRVSAQVECRANWACRHDAWRDLVVHFSTTPPGQVEIRRGGWRQSPGKWSATPSLLHSTFPDSMVTAVTACNVPPSLPRLEPCSSSQLLLLIWRWLDCSSTWHARNLRVGEGLTKHRFPASTSPLTTARPWPECHGWQKGTSCVGTLTFTLASDWCWASL